MGIYKFNDNSLEASKKVTAHKSRSPNPPGWSEVEVAIASEDTDVISAQAVSAADIVPNLTQDRFSHHERRGASVPHAELMLSHFTGRVAGNIPVENSSTDSDSTTDSSTAPRHQARRHHRHHSKRKHRRHG